MTSRIRGSTPNPEPPRTEKEAEDDVCCCCFKSSKSQSKKQANTNSKYDDSTIDGRNIHTPKEKAREGNQKEHINRSPVHTVKPSESPNLSRDQQHPIKEETYKELDHTKVATSGAQLYGQDQENSYESPRKIKLSPPTKDTSSLGQDHPWPTDQWDNKRQEKIKNNGKYTAPDSVNAQKVEDNNGSHGGTWSGPTKDKGKGNNGSHGGTRLDPTKMAISSTVEHGDPQKEKVSSTSEQAGPVPRKEKEKAISSTVEQADPPLRKEKESIPEHSYEDPFKGQHKDVHKPEYKKEDHKNTWPDLTKKESSSPEQTTLPKRKGKQNETNRLEGINTNHDNYNLNSSTTITSREGHRKQ